MSVTAYVSVAEFFAGKSVLITGGAGYLGKVLLEKLLYSCPEVDKVYLLLRDKRNVSAQQRLRAVTELPLFSRLREKRPQYLNKIAVLKGDICMKDLNLNPTDLKTVLGKVSVVLHSAAAINFNEPLKVALKTNLEGTRNVLSLCHRLKKVDAFVHVSTAYCNTDREVVEEIVYPPPASIEEVYKFIENDPDGNKTTQLLNGRPNTYTFTKALAEHWVSETHGNIPTVIIRPSIVTPSINEPVKGWVDNWYGSTGIFNSVGKGFCRVVYGSVDNVVDLMPVDLVCNMALVAAARAKRQANVDVYNSCSGSTNPITLKQIMDLYSQEVIKQRFNYLPYPNIVLYTERNWLTRTVNLMMLLGAYVADLPTQLGSSAKDSPSYTSHVKTAILMQTLLEFFSSHSWLMKTDKARALHESLSPADARQFPFLADDICWKDYVAVYVQGVNKYLTE